MNKIKIYIFLLPFISSCQSRDYKFADLEKISTKFDASVFFENKLKKTNEILKTKVETLDKDKVLGLLENPFFVKDTLAFYKSEGRFPTELYLDGTSDWMSRKKKPTEIFGYGYNTVAYNEDHDTLAVLNTVAFPAMSMVEDKKGNLMYLEANKTSKNQNDYIKIKDYLEKHCKKIEVEDDDQNSAYWENEHFFYALETKENKKEDEVSYDSLGNKNSSWITVTDINLKMYTKPYIQKMEELKIFSPGYIFWKKTP